VLLTTVVVRTRSMVASIAKKDGFVAIARDLVVLGIADE
jgi:hypothetical protein